MCETQLVFNHHTLSRYCDGQCHWWRVKFVHDFQVFLHLHSFSFLISEPNLSDILLDFLFLYSAFHVYDVTSSLPVTLKAIIKGILNSFVYAHPAMSEENFTTIQWINLIFCALKVRKVQWPCKEVFWMVSLCCTLKSIFFNNLSNFKWQPEVTVKCIKEYDWPWSVLLSWIHQCTWNTYKSIYTVRGFS